MKSLSAIWTAVIVFLLLVGCKPKNDQLPGSIVTNPNSAKGVSSKGLPVFSFQSTEHDFGRITAGEKITYTFRFKNTGSSDLVISQAKASCGCTVPEYPTKPIAPGEEGEITVTFDSSNREGLNVKTVTLVANTQPSTYVLTIKALVVKI